MYKVLAVCVLLTLAVYAETKAKPLLVIHKEVSEGYAVVGSEVKFKVTVTNQGENPAFDVQLVDKDPSGEDQTKAVDTLEAQQSLTLEYVFRPSVLGDVNIGAARATYLEEQGASARSTALSNLINEHDRQEFDVAARGELHVVTSTEYERIHTRYIKETIGYLFAAAVPVLFPFYMYRSKQAQVDHLLREARRAK